MRARRLFAWAPALLALTGARLAFAHDLDKASLTLVETGAGRFQVKFHAGSAALVSQLRAPARFPEPCRFRDDYLECGAQGLAGTIEFPWLAGTLTHVLVRVEWQNGERFLRVAGPSSPRIAVYAPPPGAGLSAKLPIVTDYGRLGFDHILSGWDHLLFVAALTLLVRRARTLLATISAFTLAHSATLAATVLGAVSLPPAPVEAVIALSVVLVCAECARPGDSLTRRRPWLIAFSFGLLHGLGFASGLLEIGVPASDLPLSLVSFNVGVELGQVAAIVAVLSVRGLWRHLRAGARLERTVIYAMGSAAAFFFVERLGPVLWP